MVLNQRSLTTKSPGLMPLAASAAMKPAVLAGLLTRMLLPVARSVSETDPIWLAARPSGVPPLLVLTVPRSAVPMVNAATSLEMKDPMAERRRVIDLICALLSRSSRVDGSGRGPPPGICITPA